MTQHSNGLKEYIVKYLSPSHHFHSPEMASMTRSILFYAYSSMYVYMYVYFFFNVSHTFLYNCSGFRQIWVRFCLPLH